MKKGKKEVKKEGISALEGKGEAKYLCNISQSVQEKKEQFPGLGGRTRGSRRETHVCREKECTVLGGLKGLKKAQRDKQGKGGNRAVRGNSGGGGGL